MRSSAHLLFADDELPEPATTVVSFNDLVGAAETGQPAAFVTPGAEEDQAAAKADPESELPLDDLFVSAPAPPPTLVVFPPAVAPSLAPAALPAVAPDALFPDALPMAAPEPGVPMEAAPAPALIAPAPIALAPGDPPTEVSPAGALSPAQPPLGVTAPGAASVPEVSGTPQSPRGLGGDGTSGANDDGNGGGGRRRTGGGAGGDAGVESNQAETEMPSPETCAHPRPKALSVALSSFVQAVPSEMKYAIVTCYCWGARCLSHGHMRPQHQVLFLLFYPCLAQVIHPSCSTTPVCKLLDLHRTSGLELSCVPVSIKVLCGSQALYSSSSGSAREPHATGP